MHFPVYGQHQYETYSYFSVYFQDCFSISILHLLAQTDITKSFKPNPLKTCVWDKCPLPACILSNFLYEYLAPKKVPIDVSFLTKNYKAFGIYNPHDIDCGDFLRSVLNVVAKNETHLTNNIKERTVKYSTHALTHPTILDSY